MWQDGDTTKESATSGMHKMFKLYSLMDRDNSGNVESHEFVATFESVVDPTFRRWIMIAAGYASHVCRFDGKGRKRERSHYRVNCPH